MARGSSRQSKSCQQDKLKRDCQARSACSRTSSCRNWGLLSLYLLLLMPVSSGLWAQTLEEALVSTYLSNPTLKEQRANLLATAEEVAEAKGDWLPTLAIEAEAQNNVIDIGDENDNFVSSSAALVLEQNLFQGGETVANVQRTEDLVMYQRARLMAIEQEVLLSATEAYANLVNNLAILDLARKNEDRLAQQLDGAKKRTRAGELTRTDVAQAEARYAGAIAERDRAIGEVESSKADYRSITNQDPASLSTLQALSVPVATEADARALARENNPTIMASRYRLAAAGADILVARAEIYPTLDLRAEVGYADEFGLDDDDDDDNDDGAAAAIGVELRIPLYQGGADYARIRRATQINSQFEESLEAATRSVLAATSRAFQDLRAARLRIGSIERQVLAAKTALDGAQKEAAVGQRTTLDLLDLENDFFQAEVDLATTRRDEVVASYQLAQAFGQLTAETLDLPVERFETE